MCSHYRQKLEGNILGLQQKCRSLDTNRLDLLQERESILRAMEEEEKDKIVLHERIKELEVSKEICRSPDRPIISLINALSCDFAL